MQVLFGHTYESLVKYLHESMKQVIRHWPGVQEKDLGIELQISELKFNYLERKKWPQKAQKMLQKKL